VDRLSLKILEYIHKRRYKIYVSLEFLPIWNFNKIEQTKDFRYLIKGIDYEHIPEIYLELSTIWNKLYSEYVEQLMGTEFRIYSNQFMQLLLLKYKNLLLTDAISVLSIKHDADIIKLIKDAGYQFNENSSDDYYNSIIDLQRQLTGLRKTIDIKEFDLQKKNQPKTDKPELEDILIILSRFNHRKIDSKTTSVDEYIRLLKDFSKQNKQQKEVKQYGRR
jgi:hypothetical protein